MSSVAPASSVEGFGNDESRGPPTTSDESAVTEAIALTSSTGGVCSTAVNCHMCRDARSLPSERSGARMEGVWIPISASGGHGYIFTHRRAQGGRVGGKQQRDEADGD